MHRYRWAFILLTLGVSHASAADPVLMAVVSSSTKTFSLSDLKRQLPPASVTVYSPVYKRSMTYRGFWLEDVLSMLHVKLGQGDIVFQCADGYGTSLSGGEVGMRKWLMAYAEPTGWTPLPDRTPAEFPGPWYVVGSDAESYQKTPWPYQVIGLRVRKEW